MDPVFSDIEMSRGNKTGVSDKNMNKETQSKQTLSSLQVEEAPLFSEEEICSMARNIGKPLPAGMKERIMAKVRERLSVR